MKNLLMVFISCALYYTVQAQGIVFEQGNFAAVTARAEAEKKLIFIDFYTSWCGPCKHMAQTVFKEDTVGRFFNSHFINYKLDAEKGEGKTLAAKYQVQIYPTYLFLDASGAVFNKAIGSCKDTVFLGVAEKARQEFTDPYSLPRLKAQYAAKKRDTAFLRLYINKLVAAQLHAFDAVEQYLSVQTTMRSDSRAMLEFIVAYPKELFYGGRAAQALEKYGEQFRQMADSLQRQQLTNAQNMIFYGTRDYAVEIKSEAMQERLVAAWEKQSPYQQSFLTREGIWLSFYSATGNWTRYRMLANHWLDSICLQLKPIGPPADPKNFYRVQDPEVVHMRRIAAVVSDNAKIYRQHFTAEKEVVKKALRWVKAAAVVNPNHSAMLTFYANLLYEDHDTANAISTKIKALNSLPATSLHRNLVQTNLEHIQRGEALEEE
jgi:thiol-disulfide isomerase/thioredoxin